MKNKNKSLRELLTKIFAVRQLTINTEGLKGEDIFTLDRHVIDQILAEVEKDRLKEWVDIDDGRYHLCYRLEDGVATMLISQNIKHRECPNCKEQRKRLKEVMGK